MNKNKRILLIAVSAFIAVSTICVAVYGISRGASEGQLGSEMVGTGWLKAFTNLSNLLMGVCAAVLLCCLLRKGEVPFSVYVLQLTGTTAVGLTMLVVIFFLAPMWGINGYGWTAMFKRDMFFFHLLNPLLASLSFIFLQESSGFKLRHRLIAVIPTVAYSLLYMTNVLILKRWSDFYNFTLGGKMWMVPVSVAVLYSASFGIASFLVKFKK